MFIDGVGDAPIHNTLLSIITMDLHFEAYLYQQWQLKDFKGVGLMPIIHDLDKKKLSLNFDVMYQINSYTFELFISWKVCAVGIIFLFLEFNHFDL